MEKRIYNFSAGPAILPEEVLLEAQKELFAFTGSWNVNPGNFSPFQNF